MLRGIALAQHLVPIQFAEEHKLALATSRGGEPEYQFLWQSDARVLPIVAGKGLRLVSWSCKRGNSRWLPATPATSLATVEEGSWKPFRPRRVEIPATLILEGQTWVFVTQGMHGLLVSDERGAERVYVICEPSSHYFRVMTHGAWMPLFIGERI